MHSNRRPSAPLVLSIIALFLALGGTTYALTIPKNSVGSKQLREGAVGAREARDNSLTGKDIRENTLGMVPLARNATQFQSNDASDFLADQVTVRTRAVPIGADADTSVDAFCDSGYRAVGGGGSQGSLDEGDRTMETRPGVQAVVGGVPVSRAPGTGEQPNAWHYTGHNAGGPNDTLQAFVICVPPAR